MFGLISLVVFVFALSGRVFGIVDYCAQNTYASNSTWLQFNKEASTCEYAIEQRFKGLHCCAKGYRSIEWYKDNRPYPWPSGVSNMILYPESANQTIYTQMVTATDTGNYTCVLRNDTHVRTHTIHLHVFSKVPDAPKITYKPKSQQVELGQSVRLFCEAFVGRIDLPDAHNDASWRRTDQNGSIEDQPGKHLVKVPREDNVTLGVYLVIEEVTEEDFGEYTCRITKPDDRYIDINVTLSEKVIVEQIAPNPVPWKKITVISAILLLLLVTIVVVNMQYGLAARVWFKDRFDPVEDGDGKQSDLLICYNQKDAEIVLGVLIPKLESKYHYKCSSREFSSNVNYWHVEMAEAARKTRRIIAILSPATLNDNWDCGSLYQALKQLQALGPPLNCIALKPMPYSATQVKNAQGETLTSILRNIHVILWERSSDNRFWLALRLNLPAKRCQAKQTTDDICLNATANNSTTRLNCNSSRGSLENLV